MRYYLYISFILVSQFVLAESIITTRILQPNINTLQVGVRGNQHQLPVINLKSQEQIKISFDEMSHNAHSYGYRIVHCNSNWTPSNLNSNEYLSGFTTANITDIKQSFNTTVVYSHYSFLVPNEEIMFKVSGNYVVYIYEDNQFDNPIAQVCFSIVDQHSNITGTIRGNTDTELNTKFQQLDFEVDLGGYTVKDILSEIKVLVRQNNRIDNQMFNLQPTSFTDSKLSYIHNKDLIFEGGNEYHRFDISSVLVGGTGVDYVRMIRPNFHFYLMPNKIQTSKQYIQDFDINGRYIINVQRASDVDIESDYAYVHFTIPTKDPFFDGSIYLGGDFNFNMIDESVKMNYSFDNETYSKELFLKQGGYNYQYWFKMKNSNNLSVGRVEGSYWQTNNEYSIYIFHRPWAERYDKLIGFKVIGN
jgi:hypothetical protein